MPQPSVSAIVLSRHRLDRLRCCLDRLLAQDYSALEGLVLANGCPETAAMVAREFPQVKLEQLPENIGCGPGRNWMARRAGGEYLAFLDDDGELRGPDTISRLVGVAEADPRAAVVGMALMNAVSDEPTGWRLRSSKLPYPCYHMSFAGGACLMRKAPFLDAGGYPEAYFSYGEEFDLAVRLYAAGWAVLYYPLVAFHHHVEKGEGAWRENLSEGYLHLQYTIARLYPRPWGLLASLKALLTQLYVHLRLMRGGRAGAELAGALRWRSRGRKESEPVARRALELMYYAKYYRVSDGTELDRAPRGLLLRVPILRIIRKLKRVPKLPLPDRP